MNRDDFFYLLGDDHWSNTACIGYAVKTCKALNYSKNEIDAFVTILNAMSLWKKPRKNIGRFDFTNIQLLGAVTKVLNLIDYLYRNSVFVIVICDGSE